MPDRMRWEPQWVREERAERKREEARLRNARLLRQKPDAIVEIYPSIRIKLWETGFYDEAGRQRVAYAFYDKGWGRAPVFVGDDFHVTSDLCDRRDAKLAAAALANFIVTGRGDVEDDYFKRYTRSQIEWMEARAETLQVDVLNFEEKVSG